MHASKLHIYQYTNVAIWLSSIKINISDPKIGILQAKTFLYVGQLDSFVTNYLSHHWWPSFSLDESKLSFLFWELYTQHRQAAEGGFSEWQTCSAHRKPGSFQKLWAICYCYGGKDSSLDFPVNRHQVPLPGAPHSSFCNDLAKWASSVNNGWFALRYGGWRVEERKIPILWQESLKVFLLLGGEREG